MSEIINAIRTMYDGAEGDNMQLDSGETIYSWILLDDGGDVVNLRELDDEQIIDAYYENTIWMEPPYEKIG